MSKKVDVNYHLFDFDFNDLCRDGVNIVLGKRNSGKSTYCKYLAHRSQHARTGSFVVITESEKVKIAWAKIIPVQNIHLPTREILRKLKTVQNDFIKEYEAKKKDFPPELHLSILMDDCGSDGEFMRSKEMCQFATYGRQWEVDVTIILHDFKQVPPEFRQQVDHWILLSSVDEETARDLKKLCVHKATVRDLTSVVDLCTPEKGAGVVISSCSNKHDIINTCFKTSVPFACMRHNDKTCQHVDHGGKKLEHEYEYSDETPLGSKWFLKHNEMYAKTNVANVKHPENTDDDDEEEIHVPTSTPPPQVEYVQEDRYGRLVIRCIGKTQAQVADERNNLQIKHKMD